MYRMQENNRIPPSDNLRKVIIRTNVKIENISGIGSENVEAVFPLVLETVGGFVPLILVRKLKMMEPFKIRRRKIF